LNGRWVAGSSSFVDQYTLFIGQRASFVDRGVQALRHGLYIPRSDVLPRETIMRYSKFALVGLTLLVSACGGGDGSASSSQSLVPPPTIAAGTLPDGATGANYAGYTFTVANGGTAPFTWSAPASMPSGLYLDPSGQVSGVPNAAGTFSFRVVVVDSSVPAQTAAHTFNLTIANTPIAIATDPTLPAGVHGSYYIAGLASTGGSAPISWKVTAGQLPPGITLSTDGTLSGTPMVASATPYQFTVTVTDSYTPTAETSSAAFSIAVSEPPAPSIYGYQLPTAIVGSPYSYAFSAFDGLAPLHWNTTAAPPDGLVFDSSGVLHGTPTTAGIFPLTVTTTDALNQNSPPTDFSVRVALARSTASFLPVGGMAYARSGHTATRLLDGRVLIAGGGLVTAELYDPVTRSFSVTGSMAVARTSSSATLLEQPSSPNQGKVLIVGGTDATAELFDPTTGTFSATGNATTPHQGHTATPLPNGKVLIAGGGTAVAELYDPTSGTFTATGTMTEPRSGHSATLLTDGRVLIAGSDASAEVYDPANGIFTLTDNMSEGRSGHRAVLLANGKVLLTGPNNSAEVFDPSTATFSVVGAPLAGVGSVWTGLYGSTATLRNDGTVLVAGGRRYPVNTVSSSSAYLFAPEAQGFVSTGSLLTARDGHTATLLLDGSVLIAGGTHHAHVCVRGWGCHGTDTVLASAEIYK
jgi:Putative Ig domain